MCNEFQFSEELELAINEFAPQAVKDVKDRKTLSDLTYEKVFWAGKIENPMVSISVYIDVWVSMFTLSLILHVRRH